MGFEIRPATAADWPRIWPFFRAICAAGETFAYPYEPSEADARSMWMIEPPGQTLVAVSPGGDVLGSATMYANRPGPGAHVASGSFMVAPEHSGQGVGRALCEELIEWSRANGFRGIQFNAVAATNERAIGLYESLGFSVVGTVPGGFKHPSEGYVGLHVMFCRL